MNDVNRELDALLGGEDGDSPIRFGEQKRPRTEADVLLDHLRKYPALETSMRLIEKQISAIKAEGRQQAVRIDVDALTAELVNDRGHINMSGDHFHDWMEGYLDRVAGLNASESPPYGPRELERIASESGQPPIVPPGIDPATGMRYRRGDDPMESVQPTDPRFHDVGCTRQPDHDGQCEGLDVDWIETQLRTGITGLVDGLAYALARADLPTGTESSRDYAERLAPLIIESGWLASESGHE